MKDLLEDDEKTSTDGGRHGQARASAALSPHAALKSALSQVVVRFVREIFVGRG